MKLQIIGAAALVAAAASLANAADLPIEPPPPMVTSAPVIDWTGFYIGLHAGYGWGQTEMDINSGAFATDYDIDGWVAGAQAGYNIQTGMWLFGLEGDIAWSNIDGSYSDTAAFDQTATTDINWLATIRGRAGVVFGNWMPYITGGVAFADVDHNISISPTGIVVLGTSESDTLFGWTAGVGVEAMFHPNWSAKLEYLYVDLEDVDFTSGADAGNFDDHINLVRAGLNYHF